MAKFKSKFNLNNTPKMPTAKNLFANESTRSLIQNYRFLGSSDKPSTENGNLAVIFEVYQAKDLNTLDEYTDKAKATYDVIKDSITDNKTIEWRAEKSEIVGTIVLPLPNSLQESTSHSWQTQPGIQSQLGNKLASAVDSATGVDPNKLIGQIANVSGTRAPIIDPGFFQQYTGTEPRKFSFSWELVIQTKAEADKIFEIIRMFKYYSAPEIMLSNAILKAPNYWNINIKNQHLKNALKLQHSVITQVDVDYAGSGVMDVYETGTPKYLKLTIGFAEIRAITRTDYVKGTK